MAVLVMWGCALCHSVACADDDADLLLLSEINQSVNHRIVFVPDAVNWGEADHWTTPEELRMRGAGDCEDYAIAKFFALRDAGVPTERLRLAYTKVLIGGAGDTWRSHMVLVYLPSATAEGDEKILDNLIDGIRPLSRRPDLRVLISFDTSGVWSGLKRGPPVRDARQIAPWARVLQRMSGGHLATAESPQRSR
jgi:predicted transglutaminase-like cysteine proteinase